MARPLRPGTRKPRPLPETILAGATLVRIYQARTAADAALTFSSLGPRHRFDHHGPSATSRAHHPDRRTAYFGFTLSCCLAELFGDTGVVEYDLRHAAVLVATRALTLLDLRGSGALRAGVNAVMGKNPNRQATQEFSRHVYDNPVIFGSVDGLIWPSAQNDEPVVVLYERAESALALVDEMPLDDPRIQTAVAEAALENNLILPHIP